jgi:iron complex transport system permease protein
MTPLSEARSHSWRSLVIPALLLLTAAAALLRLCVGEVWGWPSGGLGPALHRILVVRGLGNPVDTVQIMDLRLLRVILAIVVGATLASSGVALQSLLRNPLAEPFILGLSSGAAVGVMAQMTISYRLNQTLGPVHTGGLIGAVATMAIVFAASRRRGMLDPLGLLLVGVVVSTINGAVIMLLNYVAGPAGLREDLSRWMMGFLNESVRGPDLLVVLLISGTGIALLMAAGRSMDVATFSDEEAISLGVNLPVLRTTLFIVASVLAAGSVVLAGPIAFVGLICPHVVRLLLGPGHRALVAGSALAGATLILLADTASFALDFGQGRMPIGIFTAMLGGPVFLWMLRPHLGRGG